MKLLFLSLSLLIGSACFSQSIKIDANGNYYAVSGIDSATLKETGKTFTHNGITYPVYISKNGKLFVVKMSKNRIRYKYYLKLD